MEPGARWGTCTRWKKVVALGGAGKHCPAGDERWAGGACGCDGEAVPNLQPKLPAKLGGPEGGWKLQAVLCAGANVGALPVDTERNTPAGGVAAPKLVLDVGTLPVDAERRTPAVGALPGSEVRGRGGADGAALLTGEAPGEPANSGRWCGAEAQRGEAP